MKQTILTRLLCGALVCSLCFALLPARAKAAAATSVTIGGVTLNSTNKYYHKGAGGSPDYADNIDTTPYCARFDAFGALSQLTLDNMTLSMNTGAGGGVIHADGDLTIVLIGSNSFTNTYTADASYGVCVLNGSLTITNGGGGTLFATGGATTNGQSAGIYADSLTVSGGVTVHAAGGNVSGSLGGSDSYGVLVPNSPAANGVSVIGGSTLIATGGNTLRSSYGVFNNGSDTLLSGGSTLTAQAGTATSSTHGIATHALSLSDASVLTARGNQVSGASAQSYGAYLYTPSVTALSGSRIEAFGGTVLGASSASIGLYLSSGPSAFSLTGGTLSATGGAANAANATSYGIYSNSALTLSNGTVNATGGATNAENTKSYGIHAYGALTCGGGTITAKGGAANATGGVSYGVYGAANIDFSGGTVSATGGTAVKESFGVYSDSGVVTVEGSGTGVTATASNVTGTDLPNSFGLFGDSVLVKSGTLTATGGEAQGRDGRSNGISTRAGFKIEGGTVHATAKTADYESVGIVGGGTNGVDIQNGTVAATGGNVLANHSGAHSYGILSYGPFGIVSGVAADSITTAISGTVAHTGSPTKALNQVPNPLRGSPTIICRITPATANYQGFVGADTSTYTAADNDKFRYVDIRPATAPPPRPPDSGDDPPPKPAPTAEIPKTGDASAPALWLTLVLLSALGLALLGRKRA